MNVRVLERKNDSMKVLLEKAEPSFANALRRVLIADVPKMAIEDVEFHLGPIRGDDGKEYESVSPLFDEIIAHRLGLIPIPTDLGLYNPRELCPSCHGEGCPSCTIIYSVNRRGPPQAPRSSPPAPGVGRGWGPGGPPSRSETRSCARRTRRSRS